MMHMAMSGDSQVNGKSIEGLGRRKDGTEFPLDMSLSAWHVGGNRFYTALVRDITERKEAEDSLSAERNLLRTLIDQLPDNVFVKDLDGRLIVDNLAHRSLLGANTLDEVIGKTDFDFFAASLAASYDAAEKKIIHSGKALINQEEPTVDRGGQQRWLLTTKLPWRDHQGKLAGIVGINRDITERQQAQTLQEAVYRIAAAAETAGSLDDLYEDIHEIISSVMPAENFYITIYDRAQDLLQFPYFKDTQDEPFIGGIQPGKGLTAYVLRTGKSLLCTQAVHDDLERRGEVRLLGVPSAIWLGVPLIADGKTIGAMVVQHYSDPKAYGEREQHMLEFVSTQVALAIRRRQAEDELRRSKEALEATHLDVQKSLAREEILARTDGLTGVRNRFSFEELAVREFASAVRYGRALSVMIFDVDNLKSINDTSGHAAGDRALVLVAQAATRHTRDADVLARYGGDEFIVLLPETSASQALLVAERIRARVQSGPVGNGGNPVAVTLSIGIAELRRGPMDASVEQMVQRADKALYQAKAEGRNRSVVFD
jgi:diguanylate cyclase (GGDEF)-like protein/PAS domain S-box-containing protein